jgi:hypothetical protein
MKLEVKGAVSIKKKKIVILDVTSEVHDGGTMLKKETGR